MFSEHHLSPLRNLGSYIHDRYIFITVFSNYANGACELKEVRSSAKCSRSQTITIIY